MRFTHIITSLIIASSPFCANAESIGETTVDTFLGIDLTKRFEPKQYFEHDPVKLSSNSYQLTKSENYFKNIVVSVNYDGYPEVISTCASKDEYPDVNINSVTDSLSQKFRKAQGFMRTQTYDIALIQFSNIHIKISNEGSKGSEKTCIQFNSSEFSDISRGTHFSYEF